MTEARVIVFTVPPPPSTNEMYQRMNRPPYVTKSNAYTKWAKSAQWIAKSQLVGVPAIECRFDVEIDLPDTRLDTDNNLKCLLDLCEDIQVVTNDKNQLDIRTTHSERADFRITLIERPDAPMKKTRHENTSFRGGRSAKRKPSLNKILKMEALKRRTPF